jgi:hypothetical protein
MLWARLRLETAEKPVRFQVVPFVRLTLVVEAASVTIAPLAAVLRRR